MCGIVAVIRSEGTRYSADAEKFFRNALFCDTLRGFDSTGVIAVPTDARNHVETFKKAIAAPDFIETRAAKRIMSNMGRCSFMIGHNRAATKGLVNSQNAHPFVHGDIVGVHNGTLTSYHNLPDYQKFDVDSDALIHAIDELGEDEAIKRANGAFALIWYNTASEELKIIRNAQRPLCYGISNDDQEILVASEMGMLYWLAFRNNIKLDKVEQFEVGMLYTFNKENPLEFTKRKMEMYVSPFRGTSYQTTGQGSYRGTSSTTTSHSNSGYAATHSRLPATPDKMREERMLQRIGYEVDEQITFFLAEFELYKGQHTVADNQKRGFAVGMVLDDEIDDQNVIVHTLTQSEYDVLKSEVLVGDVVSATMNVDYNDNKRSRYCCHAVLRKDSVRVATDAELYEYAELPAPPEKKEESNVTKLPAQVGTKSFH